MRKRELLPSSPMAHLFEYRRQNLRTVVEKLGGMTKVAKRLGYKNGAYLSQLIGKNPIEELSERVARNIEFKLGLKPGSLDSDPNELNIQPVHTQLTDAISSMIDGMGSSTLDSLSSERFGQLCAIIFTQYQQGQQISSEFVQQLVKLVEVR